MASVTIHFDPDDPADLATGRRLLGRLETAFEQHPVKEETAAQGLPVGGDDELAVSLVEDLWSRIGPNLRRVMAAAAKFDGQFSLADLGDELGQEMQSVKARWAKLGSSLNAAAQAVPDAPPFVQYHAHPNDLWHFSMPPAIRDAIRKKDV